MLDLQGQSEKAEKNYRKLSEKLSKERQKAASDFVEEIRKGLSDLNFLDVQFEMRFTELESFTAGGTDQAFYLSTNPGRSVTAYGTCGIRRRIVQDHACDQKRSG